MTTKRIICHRPYKVRIGPNNDSRVVSVSPGEQEVPERVAEVGIRKGVAEAKRGRPPVRETTAVEPDEVEAKRTTTRAGSSPSTGSSSRSKRKTRTRS